MKLCIIYLKQSKLKIHTDTKQIKLTVDDFCVPGCWLIVAALDEDREDDVLQLGVAHAELRHALVLEDGLDERLPQRVHVADDHGRKEDLVQRDCW